MKRQNLRIAILVTAALVFCCSSLHASTSRSPSSTTTKHARSSPSAGGTKSSGTRSSGLRSTRTTARKARTATRSGATKSTTAKTNGAKAVASTAKTSGAKPLGSAPSSKSGKRGTKAAKGGRQRGQMAPTSDRISEIQSALAKNGALDGSPTGKWDESTSEAMRKFQAAHGLNPSGKLDALTLRQLGLGSSTAGLAPPTPMARTSSTNLPADIQQ
jgi:peptidoglycan hydrolase-like protein with peptidoglycan-binding domain